MDSYFDLHLYQHAEFKPNIVTGFVYEALHMSLVDLKEIGIGLSFPKFRMSEGKSPGTLGGILRVHGQAEALERVKKNRWFQSIPDLAQVGEVLAVPETTRYRVVRRVQPVTNVERLRRRYAKRHAVSEEEAAQRIPNSVEERSNLPFVRFRSRSTGQMMVLFVRHDEITDQPSFGQFSSYGLSRDTSIPWF